MQYLISILTAALLCTAAQAATPENIVIHGQLLDTYGKALTGDRAYSVTFYDAETGGAALDSVLTGTVTLSAEGIFDISITPPEAILTADAVWYAVAVDSDETANGLDENDLFPERVRVESAAFALQAEESFYVEAAGVGAGTVDDTELAALDGVSGPVQDQIDTKADASELIPKTAVVRSRTYPNEKLSGYTYIGTITESLTAIGAEPDVWSATSSTDAPGVRSEHTSVWTGSKMIVWGGRYNSGRLNTGGLYDPAADTWTGSTTTTDAPSARSGHTAVWTDSKMIVWGGYTGSNRLNTGGLYDPDADAWTATSTTDAPSARYAHTAVWTGSKMIIWGGSNSGGLNTGGIYDPETDTWTATSTNNAPSARYAHTAVWTGSKMIVWGGADGSELNTGSVYDPETDTWTTVSTDNAPAARSYHTSVWTGSKMIVWGGYGDTGFLNTGGVYDPDSDTWTSITDTVARGYHTTVWTGSKMVVWGGVSGPYLNTGGVYDPDTGAWTRITGMDAPAVRARHTAVWTGSEMVVWGGYNGSSYLSAGGAFYAAPTETTFYLYRKN